MSRLRIQLEGCLPWDPSLVLEAVTLLFPKKDLSYIEEKNKELISKITDTHDSISRPRSILTKAMWIGEMLLKQKKELSHGEFVKFIERNFPFSLRTAQHYMRAYKNKDKIEEAQVKSIRGVYKIIAGNE
jgi:hypothetical protein